MSLNRVILGVCVLSALAVLAYFAVNRRLRHYRYQCLLRDAQARWGRLKISRKIEILQEIQGLPIKYNASEAEIDRIFLQFLANSCEQMQRQGSFDMTWLRLE